MAHPAVPEILDSLMSFEDVATYEHVFANTLVPGLLQTPRYAFALHETQDIRTKADVIAGGRSYQAPNHSGSSKLSGCATRRCCFEWR